MSTDLAVVQTEVLEPGQRTLRELATEANREGHLLIEAGSSMVEHAIRMGEHLLLAQERVGSGGWQQWIAENYDFGYTWAATSMRAARYQDEVRASGVTSISGIRRHLSAIEAPRANNGRPRRPEWMRKEAIRLRKEEGLSTRAIATELGVSNHAVRYWTDPDVAKRSKQASSRAAKKRAAAYRALREQEREQAIKRAVRKEGGAMAELYVLAERAQDVQGQAHREATDTDRRQHLALAGEHYRKWRDEIVRALGVT